MRNVAFPSSGMLRICGPGRLLEYGRLAFQDVQSCVYIRTQYCTQLVTCTFYVYVHGNTCTCTCTCIYCTCSLRVCELVRNMCIYIVHVLCSELFRYWVTCTIVCLLFMLKNKLCKFGEKFSLK